MAIDLKTLTPDTSVDITNGVFFGADSQGAAGPSVYTYAAVKTSMIGNGSVDVAATKTLTASNTLTLAGTDGSTLNIGAGGTLGSLALKGSVDLADINNIGATTFLGNSTTSSAKPTDITATIATGMLDNFQADTGTGGKKGLVPAPAAGTGANKYLRSDGSWIDVLPQLTVAATKHLNVNNTLTLAGTDGTTATFPATNANLAGTNISNTFSATNTFSAVNTFSAGSNAFTGASPQILAGVNGGARGALKLFGDISGDVTIRAASAAGASTIFQLPTSNGLNQQILHTDGTGGTYWGNNTAASGGTLPSGLIITSPTPPVFQLGAADTNASADVTFTAGTPGIVTWPSAHELYDNSVVNFTTTGTLPAGLTAGQNYLINRVSSTTFSVSASVGGPQINLADTGTGVHNARKGSVSQTLQVQSTTAGLSNLAGSPFFINGSRGTGTGAGGSIIFQVAPAGSSGTAQNAYQTILTIAANGVTTFGGPTIAVSAPSFNASTSLRLVSNSATINFGSSADLILARDAANTLALRNSTNAQTFNVYNTYTDASNYERLSVAWSGNICSIRTNAAGSGTGARQLILGTHNASLLALGALTVGSWNIDDTGVMLGYGNLLFGTDNTYDIGAATTTRPRNVFIAGYEQMTEMTAPAAPAANSVRIYAEDNGSGKTRLMALFATGAAQQIAIEP